MKNMTRKFSMTLLITLLVILPVAAQGGPPATPIDGGLSLLLAAGGIYALKKLKEHRRS